MAHRIRFVGERQVELEDFEPGEPGAGQVRIRSLRSLLSSGTESIVYARRFEPGTHWDQWVKYPFYPGYALMGIIDAVGEGVSDRAVGDRVVCRSGHASAVVVAADEVFPVPAKVGNTDACWFALAKITAMGARAAAYVLGDSMMIVGAGPIGQMSLRWARACGVETISVVDRVPQRLALARHGGATAVFSDPLGELRDRIRSAHDGVLPRVVMDSTGNHRVLADALGLAERFGTVVLMGDTGTPSGQHLTSDVIIRGLRIVGAHDGHEVEGWTAGRIYRLFFRMLESGRISVKGLTTTRFEPTAFREAYELAASQDPDTMGIVFDWSDG